MKGSDTMSLLHGATSIFIEFEGILYDTDLYVVREIYDYMMSHDDKVTLFDELPKIMDKVSPRNLKYLLQTKQYQNPLYDYITEDIELDDDSDVDLEDLADGIYSETLYNFKYVELPPDGEPDPDDTLNTLRLTMIGTSLKSIIMDENMKNVYIYFKKAPNDDILKVITEDLGDHGCIQIVHGDLHDAMINNLSDVYFLNNVLDIYCLATKKYEDEISIVLPMFLFNMVDDPESTLIDLEENAIAMKRKYNIEVCSTRIPIV